MKRVRERAVIEAERAALDAEIECLQKRRRLLSEELETHPECVAAKARAARFALERALPWRLHFLLLNVDFPLDGRLKKLAVESEVTEDHNGNPVKEWRCEVTFEHRYAEYRAFIAPDPQDFPDFVAVDFAPFSRQLWFDALQENDDDVGKALAALCFACCEYLEDWDALPAAAFPAINKGKREMDTQVPLGDV